MPSERDDGFARCNFDGKPLHPGDAKIMAKFREWLAMTPEQREQACEDSEWREFLGLPPLYTHFPPESGMDDQAAEDNGIIG